MVVYEAKNVGVSRGWFYWTFKVEGGAFAEWDYLRGIREGWVPKTERGIASVDQFGSCEDIIFKTEDDVSIVHEFPDPKSFPEGVNWQGVAIDDDVVVSHGQSLIDNTITTDDDEIFQHKKKHDVSTDIQPIPQQQNTTQALLDRPGKAERHSFGFIFFIGVIGCMLAYRFSPSRRQRYASYRRLSHSNHGPLEMSV